MEILAENISVVNKSELEGSLRIDAEYYQPQYLEAERKIRNIKHEQLKNLISILTDYHANGSYETLRNNVELLDNPDYALMIRTVDFEKEDFDKDVKYISEHAYNFLKKTQLFGYEIVINKIGNAGKVYIVPPLNRKISLGMNQFMIRPNKKINGKYLYVFLTTSLGSRLLQQRITGAVPLSIDKESVRNVLIPILDDAFQLQIDTLIEKCFTLKLHSKSLYSQAEELLLDHLSIKNFVIDENLTYTTNLKDAINSSRIDAEYFQPKYKRILSHTQKNCKTCRLGDIVTIKKGIEPGSAYYQDEGIPFIRVSNLSKYELTDNNQQYLAEEFYNRLRKDYQPEIDEILLSKDATPGIALVNREEKSMIICGGILRLISKNSDINNEYLALVLNSIVVQLQIERDVGGSIINHWRPDQIKETIIPVLPKQTQDKLADLVVKSCNARKEAKSLLDQTKRKVEDMVERGIDAN